MTGAVIILLVTIFVGLLLYIYDLKYRKKHPDEGVGDRASGETSEEHGEICCGKHLVCENPLAPKIGEEIVYYDDEELDRFAGRDADGYSSEEIEEVREVMLTLLPQDVAGWARSIRLRGINLPTPLRDELFLLIDNE